MSDLYGIPSQQLLTQLERHEGFRARPYLCTAGACTIGYGTNLDAHPQYIDDPELRRQVMVGKLRGSRLMAALLQQGVSWDRERARAALLDEVIACRESLFLRCPQFRRLAESGDSARAEALLNMAFNLGVDGLLKFRATLGLIDSAMNGGSWLLVEGGLRNSRWWSQVGRRAVELGRQFVTGEYAEDF